MPIVLGLPLVSAALKVSPDEDFMFGLLFTLADRSTALNLSGLTFTLTIASPNPAVLESEESAGATPVPLFLDPANGTIFAYLAAGDPLRESWQSGQSYQMRLSATDGTFTYDVFTGSVLTVSLGNSAPFTLTAVPSFATSVLTAIAYAPPNLSSGSGQLDFSQPDNSQFLGDPL